RRMACEAVDRALAMLGGPKAGAGPCLTASEPLPGARGLEPPNDRGIAALATALERQGSVDHVLAHHLAATYGTRAGDVLRHATTSTVTNPTAVPVSMPVPIPMPKPSGGALPSTTTTTTTTTSCEPRSLLSRLDPELPYVLAEVDHAVIDELARTVEDVLVRRLPLALRGRDQGLDAADLVSRRMASLLSWSEDTRCRQLDAFKAYVAHSRRFREA
ncbi:MAG: glycerol-3-phosphate dehydrogenase C-terminal domain-containing protein, partial [Pseudomonadota bacterium]